MTSELIDRIYECSFSPELWPDVLDQLADIIGARGGILCAVRDRQMNWTSSENMREIFASYVNDGWFKRCPRRLCLFGGAQPIFQVEHDFWTTEELDATPIYRDFFRPRGLGWSAGTGLPMPTGDNIFFSIERNFRDGPVEAARRKLLNGLRPHLARAAMIAARLGLQHTMGAKDVMSSMGLPAMVLDENGAVVEANTQCDAIKSHVRWRASNRVSFVDAQANDFLVSALASLNSDKAPSIRSFPLRDKSFRAALVAHIVPIRRSAHDIFARGYALLVVTEVTGSRTAPVELLKSLFDFTGSEARVARALSSGQTIEEIATSGGVAISTVRSQLRQILAKTGCARQAEVVALLANVVLKRDLGDEAPGPE